MRYLLHKTQLGEMTARQEYLYDIFHLYFLPREMIKDYVPLSPVGEKGPDLLFVTGHTHHVKNYLDAMLDQITEESIIITSCFGQSFKKYSSKKNIYVPNTKDDYCSVRVGSAYGFGFNISDAELNFYNATGDIMQRILSTYILL